MPVRLCDLQETVAVVMAGGVLTAAWQPSMLDNCCRLLTAGADKLRLCVRGSGLYSGSLHAASAELLDCCLATSLFTDVLRLCEMALEQKQTAYFMAGRC